MKEIINAIVQGIIQGVTEFLPVSSSGHLALYQYFTSGEVTGEGGDLLLSVVLHLGTLLAVFVAFRARIGALIVEFFGMIKDIFTGKFKWKGMNLTRRMLIMLFVACLPLVFLLMIDKAGFPVIGYIETAASVPVILGLAFLVTAVLLHFAQKAAEKSKGTDKITVKHGLFVGFFQAIAVTPGISRSGATISAGLFSGLDKQTAFEFSFILSIPAILGANALEIVKALGEKNDMNIPALLLGAAAAAIVGYFSIKLLEIILKKDKFKIFAIYTFILGTLVFAEGIYELIAGQTVFQAMGII